MAFLGSVGKFIGSVAGAVSKVAPVVSAVNPALGLGLGSFSSAATQIFPGQPNPAFGSGTPGQLTVANYSQPSASFPNILGTPAPVFRTQAATGPGVVAAGGAMMRFLSITSKFAMRFPSLTAAINNWRAKGVNITRAKLYSLLRRFGPEVLITGGILTAAAVNELMMAGPGRRRMNPGNAKALRRSLRRLESFHHLCVRADKFRRRGGTRRGGRGAAQQFVRQG